MSSDLDLILRARRAVWLPCTQMKALDSFPPLAVARGEGPWLIDVDGRRYLDAIGSWWVNLFGHANPRINAAIRDQLDILEHAILAGAVHEPVVALSERLAGLTKLGHAFYGSDGASATEIALKMSFHFWRNVGRPGKTAFVSLKGGYHGETLGALSVTDVALFRDVYAPLLRATHRVPSPDWRDAEPGETAEAFAHRCADALGTHLAEHHATTAALILEPLVQCAAGMAMYHPAYLARAREICDRFDVHLIADEIAVGFGRTGTMFACQQAGVRPDFLCLSKGITGGYLPLSVVLTTDAVYAAFYDDDTARGFLHSHSYTGNPLACRAALAVLDIFDADGVLQKNRGAAALLAEASAPIAAHPRVRHFRQAGMILAFDVANAAPGFAGRYARAALDEGLLLRPIGNTVYFMPPYVLGEAEMRQLASGALAALEKTT